MLMGHTHFVMQNSVNCIEQQSAHFAIICYVHFAENIHLRNQTNAHTKNTSV
jgi:hypothetical protein